MEFLFCVPLLFVCNVEWLFPCIYSLVLFHFLIFFSLFKYLFCFVVSLALFSCFCLQPWSSSFEREQHHSVSASFQRNHHHHHNSPKRKFILIFVLSRSRRLDDHDYFCDNYHYSGRPPHFMYLLSERSILTRWPTCLTPSAMKSFWFICNSFAPFTPWKFGLYSWRNKDSNQSATSRWVHWSSDFIRNSLWTYVQPHETNCHN